MRVDFETKAVKNNFLSEEKGYDVYEDVVYITKYTSDQTNIPSRPMRESDKEKFPREWALFCEGKRGRELIIGCPLSQMIDSPSVVKTLEDINIFTVEGLASAADGHIESVMGGMSLKRQAKEFLANKDKEAQEKINEKVNKLTQNTDEEKDPRRGRPRKEN